MRLGENAGNSYETSMKLLEKSDEKNFGKFSGHLVFVTGETRFWERFPVSADLDQATSDLDCEPGGFPRACDLSAVQSAIPL